MKLLANRAILAALMMNSSMAISSGGELSAGHSRECKVMLDWGKLPPLPDRYGFAAPFAGVTSGHLLVAGGTNFADKTPWDGGKKIWHDTIFSFSKDAVDWTVAGHLPRANGYGVSVTTPAGIICAGGGNADKHFVDVFMLTWNGTRLVKTDLPSLPEPCAYACGAFVDGVIYIAGGISQPDSSEATKNFWALDLARVSAGWITLPSWPGPARMLAVSASHEHVFYLLSGAELKATPDGKPSRNYLVDAYAYRAGTGWRRIADLPRAAVAAPSPAPVTRSGRLLVLTGDDGKRVHLNGPNHPGFPTDMLVYDPAKDSWEVGEEVPFSRATVPVAMWEGSWIIPSGERIPGYRSSEVWSLTVGDHP